jgi:hypothetical protein
LSIVSDSKETIKIYRLSLNLIPKTIRKCAKNRKLVNTLRPKASRLIYGLINPKLIIEAIFQQFVDSVSLLGLFIYEMRSNKFVP